MWTAEFNEKYFCLEPCVFVIHSMFLGLEVELVLGYKLKQGENVGICLEEA